MFGHKYFTALKWLNIFCAVQNAILTLSFVARGNVRDTLICGFACVLSAIGYTLSKQWLADNKKK